MRIDRIEIYQVTMPLVTPFRTAFSDEEAIDSLLVRMSSPAHSGWGESSPWRAPAYSSEWAGAAFLTVRDWLAPRLVGREVESGAELQRLLSPFKGNYFAKASLDLAWWDLYAHEQDRPLWQVLGGVRDTVDVGADIGVLDTLDALLAEIDQAQAAGFKRTKLKFRPGWEVDMVAGVRQAFPDLVIHVDCNSAYRLQDLAMFRELDRYGLAMIEQPLAHDDLADHARLQGQIQTPLCLDESIVSVDKARKAIALGSCRWVNIKPGRVGGLTQALAIHDLCQEAGIPCWVGGMLESAVGQSHNLALATLPNIRYPSDIFPTSRFYRQDLGVPEMDLSGLSEMRAVAGPGIGCAPHPERLAERLVQAASVPPE
jgi:O-succinylbenzoate synthase